MTGNFQDDNREEAMRKLFDLYKDKRRPLDKHKFPNYLAKQILNIEIPIKINTIIADDIDIHFSARQPNKLLSEIDINIMEAKLNNVQNIHKNKKLSLEVIGKVHNSIPFDIHIEFDYSKDILTYNGKIHKSYINSLKKPIRSFIPIEINSGIINSMHFEGHASRTTSKGSMVFLYQDLNIEIQSDDKQKKKGMHYHLLSAAANTIMHSNNPANPDLPARKVEYTVVRDMNKGFINLIIKSILSGVKESILPSRENRKHYKELRKHSKK